MTNQYRAIPDRVSFLDVVLARLEAIFMSLTEPPYCAQHVNYLEPAGDPGIFGPTSVTWRVLSNPVSVFIRMPGRTFRGLA
jgi:uncharacterized protein (DUF2236 family)